MKTLKMVLKQKETIIGITIAIMFQLIFFTVWMTAYDKIEKRLDQFKVAVVNEDEHLGKQFFLQMKKQVPFKVKEEQSLLAAQKKLDQREFDMVVFIPKQLSNNILSQQQAIQAVQGSVKEQGQMVKTAAQEMTKEPVKPAIIKVNPAPGFKETMVPLMIVLASFVGAMIMSLQLHQGVLNIAEHHKKWPIFWSRQVINLGISFLLALLTISLVKGFNIEIKESLSTLWLFQSLVYFAFLGIAQISLLLFGMAGMLVNILILATQLVSSGAIIPRSLLSEFYQSLSEYLPATYAAEGYFSIIFGGGPLKDNLWMLVLMILTLYTAASIKTFFTKEKSLAH